MDIELPLLASSSTLLRYTRGRCLLRGACLRAGGAVGVIAGGTLALPHLTHESWIQAFYRSVVTSSLTGLDTVPSNNSTRLISIVLVLAGLTIFAFIATILVEGIAGGIFTGAVAERRRKRAIEKLTEHYVICGYGRVGRRVGEEFRRGRRPVRRARPQRGGDRARPRGRRPLHQGQRHERRGSRGDRPRGREGPRRLVGLGRRQPLHHALRANGQARPADRRARLRRGRGREAQTGRRGPHRPAVLGGRQGNGGARPAPAGGRVPRGRVRDGRGGPPVRGDRRHGGLRAVGEDDPRAAHPARDRGRDRRAAQGGRDDSTRRPTRTPSSSPAT